MPTLLIVEDEPSDLRLAADLTSSLGFTEVQARTSAAAGKVYLEAAMEGRSPIPDVIILDLDLGYDSGFELLRFWHSQGESLRRCRLVVWTGLGEEQHGICRLFKVDAIISKGDGVAALRQAIQPFIAKAASE